MPDDPPPPAPPPSPALDRDLNCLTCGYNLRGLSGDPIRCLECGNLNPIGDVEVPAAMIAKTLRRMETGPAVCVCAVLFGAPLPCTLIGALWYQKTPIELVGDFPCFIIMALFAAPVWLIGCWTYRSSCRAKTGWLRGLLAYHFWGLLLIFACLIGVARAILLITNTAERWGRAFPGAGFVIVLTGILLLGVVVVLSVRILYRRAVAPLHRLQREVAVDIAREEIRKKLARPHKHLLG